MQMVRLAQLFIRPACLIFPPLTEYSIYHFTKYDSDAVFKQMLDTMKCDIVVNEILRLC